MPDKRPSGEHVDARRVEAAVGAFDDWMRRGRYAERDGQEVHPGEAILRRSDDAVGGVVARETADALAEALERLADPYSLPSPYEHRCLADRALAAYRQATGQ